MSVGEKRKLAVIAAFINEPEILLLAVQTVAHLIANNIAPVALAKLGYTELAGNLINTMIVQVNISALMVFIAMTGVCFLFSGIFSASKYSIGFSGTFIGVTVLANMLAMIGNLGVGGLENFK